jgi:ferredoxin-nitrite reductase
MCPSWYASPAESGGGAASPLSLRSSLQQKLHPVRSVPRCHKNVPYAGSNRCGEQGSHDLYEHPHINDIAYIPATKDGVFGFNVIFGGFFSATACKESIPLDVFVTPQQMVPICHATLTAFRDYGARQNRQKTRVMYLIEQMGLEGFRAELEKRVGCTLATEGESMVDPKWERRSYFGVNKQKDGDNFVGVCVPAGRLSPDDMLAVAHLAEAYGDGDIRLTVEQNLILSGVPDSNVDELLAQPILQKLHVNPGALSAGLVSCPGSQFCGFGQIETKANAIELTHKLEAALNIPPGVRIHWTGCPNSCGQAQVADIGLLGTTTKTAEGVVPAVEIFTGGRIGWDSHLADTYKSKVPVVDLVEELSELLIANHGATRK